MTDRPIIFSAPMVRALLAGCKTQTRRVLKPQPHPMAIRHEKVRLVAIAGDVAAFESGDGTHDHVRIPYSPGDRLWVREAWAHDAPDLDTARRGIESGGVCYGPYYRADAKPFDVASLRWRSSIHMPRWASRMTLTVTAVRVQRLQDITEDDARAEGIEDLSAPDHVNFGVPGIVNAQHPVRAFWLLWESIHGPGAWVLNPWVAAISFTVERRNIDAEE